MLFANGAHRDDLALAVGEGGAEDGLAEENALAVMAQRPVTEVGEVRLALVEPVVDGEIVLRRAAEQAGGMDSVVVGVRHGNDRSSSDLDILHNRLGLGIVRNRARVQVGGERSVHGVFAGPKAVAKQNGGKLRS